MLQADPDKVSPRAKKRGLPQVKEPPSYNVTYCRVPSVSNSF